MSRANIPLLLLLCLGFLGLPLPGQAAVLSGKLSYAGKPAVGVTISAYPLAASSLAGPAPHVSAPTGDDGLYRFQVPAGTYYLIASGAGYYAYYGRNPVTVGAAGQEGVNISLVERRVAPPEGQSFVETGLFGRVTVAGKPMAGVRIYVYPDLTSELKGMGLGILGPTDAQGRFESELAPGTYYLVARYRQNNAFAGPLQAGDFIGVFPDNPVKIKAGMVVRAGIPLLEVPAKVERYADRLFGATSIHGRVLDAAGKPVTGVRAILYDDPTMLNRPLYVSQPTGADGRFVLSFPKGGTYYLGARNTLGGAPGPGDLYGTWDGNPDHELKVADGASLTGIEIVVEEMW